MLFLEVVYVATRSFTFSVVQGLTHNQHQSRYCFCTRYLSFYFIINHGFSRYTLSIINLWFFSHTARPPV